MLGINLYKLFLSVRGYEHGQKKKKRKNKAKPNQNKKYFAREVKKGGKVLLHSLNYENNYIFVTCSVVKIFSAVWTIH